MSSHGERPEYAGPYRLCLELASGGMATVYLAHNDAAGSTARFAAVKLVHPHLAADPGFLEMFVDESEIASRIRHPNVCAVYDYEVSEGRSYLAMEYLIGEPMAAVWRKLARTRADPARTARLIAKSLADACEGLHAAHELTDAEGEPLEIVHRDVSPGNIVLTFDGVTKVVDFGVAAAARKRHRTQTGMLKGKLAYIAPECLRGTKADRRCDVWGIGVVAWELVTGERLFRAASDVETLRAVMDKPIPRPSEVRPELPRALDDVIMLALERDPDDRYANARDLGRDLARVANAEDVITASDLGEWLDGLFPGAKDRRRQLLDIAAQIARGERAPASQPIEREKTAPTQNISTAGMRRTPGEHELTRVYPREPTPTPRPTSRSRLVSLVLGVLAGIVAGSGSAFVVQRYAASSAFAPPTREEPHDAAPRPAAMPIRSELRIGPGAGLARGPYVLELVESNPDELLLRIRLDRDRETSAIEPAPSQDPTMQPPPRPETALEPPIVDPPRRRVR